MPSSSKAQHDFMMAIAHGRKPSGRKNAPTIATAQEFMKEDKKAGKYQKRKARGTIATGGK